LGSFAENLYSVKYSDKIGNHFFTNCLLPRVKGTPQLLVDFYICKLWIACFKMVGYSVTMRMVRVQTNQIAMAEPHIPKGVSPRKRKLM